MNQTNALLKTLELTHSQPALAIGASGPVTSEHSAPPVVGRAKVDRRMLAAAYLAGSTLIELAEQHGVSASTIKRVLHDDGTRKYQRTG